MSGVIPSLVAALSRAQNALKKNVADIRQNPTAAVNRLAEAAAADLQEQLSAPTWAKQFQGKALTPEEKKRAEREKMNLVNTFAGVGSIAAPAKLLDRGTPTVRFPTAGEVGFLGGTEKWNEKLLQSVPEGQLTTVPLSEVLQNPKLYDRYPGWKDTPVELLRNNRQTSAGQTNSAYLRPDGTVGVDYKFIEGPYGLKQSVRHELTHKGARAEGLPRGSSNAAEAAERRKLIRWIDDVGGMASPHQQEMMRRLQKQAEAELYLWGPDGRGLIPYRFNEGEAIARFGEAPGNIPDVPLQFVTPDLAHAVSHGKLPNEQELSQVLANYLNQIRGRNADYAAGKYR